MHSIQIIEALRIIGSSILAFVLALAATPVLINFLKNFQLRKQIRVSSEAPIFMKLHKNKEGTPTMGGVVIWGTAIFLAIVFWLVSNIPGGFWSHLNFMSRAETYLPIAAMVIAALIGLLDDWLGIMKIGAKGGGLKVRHKLVLYAIIAAVGAWWFYFKLDWHTLYVPFVGNVTVDVWYIPIFMFIMIATAFSANETDGLDGLLGGVSLFAFSALTVVAFAMGKYDLAAFSGIIVGSLLAFLWFNIYPAKVFMGDTGSMALGITMGTIALLTNTALLLPLFAIILVIESLSVIIQLTSKKFRGGKKVFLSTPIHHHFEAIGWPESEVTMRFWIISAVFAGLGLALFFLARLI